MNSIRIISIQGRVDFCLDLLVISVSRNNYKSKPLLEGPSTSSFVFLFFFFSFFWTQGLMTDQICTTDACTELCHNVKYDFHTKDLIIFVVLCSFLVLEFLFMVINAPKWTGGRRQKVGVHHITQTN